MTDGARVDPRAATASGGVARVPLGERWFASHGKQPFAFQRDVWDAIARGESGLVHATTGSGKTYAVWLGALDAFARGIEVAGHSDPKRSAAAPPLTVLWITPMRALAADTERALNGPLKEFGSTWTVGMRSGDTSASMRARQARRLPTALITTPESLSLLLSRADARERFAHLQIVVVDEWHELIGNKRGVQTQLALARLRQWRPEMVTWGLSATLGNLEYALDVLVPAHGAAPAGDVARSARPIWR